MSDELDAGESELCGACWQAVVERPGALCCVCAEEEARVIANDREIASLRAERDSLKVENAGLRAALTEAACEVERWGEGRGNGDLWWVAWLKRANAALAGGDERKTICPECQQRDACAALGKNLDGTTACSAFSALAGGEGERRG